jgi:hypothetical protein
VIEKRPDPSVVAVRTRSMSAGLATSTVTPGSTAPDVSLTSPAIPLVWADAASGRSSAKTDPTNIRNASLRMLKASSENDTHHHENDPCVVDFAVFVPLIATRIGRTLAKWHGNRSMTSKS